MIQGLLEMRAYATSQCLIPFLVIDDAPSS
jgi:hypothetical protein